MLTDGTKSKWQRSQLLFQILHFVFCVCVCASAPEKQIMTQEVELIKL